eukprot:4806962-Pleurochrysis_carterae.AAC.1
MKYRPSWSCKLPSVSAERSRCAPRALVARTVAARTTILLCTPGRHPAARSSSCAHRRPTFKCTVITDGWDYVERYHLVNVLISSARDIFFQGTKELASSDHEDAEAVAKDHHACYRVNHGPCSTRQWPVLSSGGSGAWSLRNSARGRAATYWKLHCQSLASCTTGITRLPNGTMTPCVPPPCSVYRPQYLKAADLFQLGQNPEHCRNLDSRCQRYQRLRASNLCHTLQSKNDQMHCGCANMRRVSTANIWTESRAPLAPHERLATQKPILQPTLTTRAQKHSKHERLGRLDRSRQCRSSQITSIAARARRRGGQHGLTSSHKPRKLAETNERREYARIVYEIGHLLPCSSASASPAWRGTGSGAALEDWSATTCTATCAVTRQ